MKKGISKGNKTLKQKKYVDEESTFHNMDEPKMFNSFEQYNNQSQIPTTIMNNTEITNNHFNQNYHFKINQIENITQNIYIQYNDQNKTHFDIHDPF